MGLQDDVHFLAKNQKMKSVIIIILGIVCVFAIFWAIFSQDFSDSERLQNAIDECTSMIDNVGPSARNLERCLDDAYNQYGNAEQKQNWFDDEH